MGDGRGQAVLRPDSGPGFERYAGNSGEHSAPWIGRSLRILFVNFARGVGCAMESLGHSLERMATCGALPYYERYFREYAVLDLDRRYGLPFESLYLQGRAPGRLPDADDAPVPARAGASTASRTISPPAATCTSCPTGASTTTSTRAARCSRRSRPGASRSTRRAPWTPAVLEPYRDLADDCMGRWVVYWRQNMPGLDNTALDDDGRPMKNWWPFLFY